MLTSNGIHQTNKISNGVRVVKVIQIAEFDQHEISLDSVISDGILDVDDTAQRFLNFRFSGRNLVISPTGFIGLIQLNTDIVVDVRPRIDADIVRIFKISGTMPMMVGEVLRHYVSTGRLVPNLLEVYVHSLELAIRRVIERGLIRKFVDTHQETTSPSGRILLDQTLRRLWSRGVSYKVVEQRHVRSTDVEINRLLLAAVHKLNQLCQLYRGVIEVGKRRDMVRRLNLCMLRLGNVTLVKGDSLKPLVVPDRLTEIDPRNSYYNNAAALARTILVGSGIALDAPTGDLALRNLVLRMSTAFEDYVRVILQRGSRSRQAALEVLDGNKLPPAGGALASVFDDGSSRPVTPDIVIKDSQVPQQHLLIVDVKYKAMRDGLDRDDLNQILVYGLVYRAPRVLIVQPANDASRVGLHRMGEVKGISVYKYGLDVSKAHLEDREVDFVDEVLELLAI